MKTIFLSPHLDDAALSCGGLIWEMTRSGREVEVWTVCAGLPLHTELSDFAQELHNRWGLSMDEAVLARKEEDQQALAHLGVPGRNFNTLDAIYRRHPKTGEFLYTSEEGLFGGVQPGDQESLCRLAIDLANALPPGEVTVVSPLTVGNHVDHLLVRSAAELLSVRLAYYPDYPYTRENPDIAGVLAPGGYSPEVYPVSAEGLRAWQDSVAAYTSQFSTFWGSEAAMREEIAVHRDKFRGVTLWEASG